MARQRHLAISLRTHTARRLVGDLAMSLMFTLQKPNNYECALFKADDKEALKIGDSTFIEIGK